MDKHLEEMRRLEITNGNRWWWRADYEAHLDERPVYLKETHMPSRLELRKIIRDLKKEK